MTEQTQPTDAELEALAEEHLDAVHQFGRLWIEGQAAFARAVLAKWGTPAGAGEVVAWGIFDSQGFYEAASDQESAERFCAHYNKRKGADPLKPYTAKPLTTPQPTQAQAGAVPTRAFLERTLAAMEGVIDVADRKTDEFDALRSCVIDLTLMLFKPEKHPTSQAWAVPLTDEWIRSKCKEPWIFETAKQWVRMAESAHGIKGADHA